MSDNTILVRRGNRELRLVLRPTGQQIDVFDASDESLLETISIAGAIGVTTGRLRIGAKYFETDESLSSPDSVLAFANAVSEAKGLRTPPLFVDPRPGHSRAPGVRTSGAATDADYAAAAGFLVLAGSVALGIWLGVRYQEVDLERNFPDTSFGWFPFALTVSIGVAASLILFFISRILRNLSDVLLSG